MVENPKHIEDSEKDKDVLEKVEEIIEEEKVTPYIGSNGGSYNAMEE